MNIVGGLCPVCRKFVTVRGECIPEHIDQDGRSCTAAGRPIRRI